MLALQLEPHLKNLINKWNSLICIFECLCVYCSDSESVSVLKLCDVWFQLYLDAGLQQIQHTTHFSESL